MANPFDQFDSPQGRGILIKPAPAADPRIPQTMRKTEQEIAETEEERRRKNRNDALDRTQRTFSNQSDLRKEFEARLETKKWRTVRPIYETAKSTPPTPAGDLNLVFAFAKIVDPESVVREGEAAAVQNTDTLAGQTVARLQKELGEGGIFSAVSRANLRAEMQRRMMALTQDYQATRTQYKRIADGAGFPVNDILGDEPDYKSIAAPITAPSEVATEGKKSTDADMAAQRALQALARTGASFEQLQAAAGELNYNLPADLRTFMAENPGAVPTIGTPESGVTSFINELAASPVGAAALGATNIGGLADEVAAAGMTITNDGLRGFVDGSFSENLAEADRRKQDIRGANPVPFALGEIASNVAAPFAAGRLAGAAGSRALGAAANRPILASLVGGGAYGVGEENQNRLTGGATNAVAGGVGGAVGKYAVAPLAQAILDTAPVRGAINNVAGRFGRQGIPENVDAGQRMIGTAVMNDPVGNIRNFLTDAERLGLPAGLADASPQLRSLAGAATRRSPDVRQMAEDTLLPRALDQADRAQEQIARNLTAPVDPAALTSQIEKNASTQARPFYEAAFARSAPVDENLATILNNPTMKEAYNRAARIAENEGVDPRTVGFGLNEAGEVTAVQNPSWQTLDLIKRGLDSQLYKDGIKLSTKGDPMLQSIDSLRGRYMGVIDNLPGAEDYKQARAIYQENIAPRNALQLGQEAPATQVLPRTVQSQFGELKPNQVQPFQQGYATSLSDTVNKARFSANPYEAIYGSPSAQGKVATVFPQGSQDFDRAYRIEQQMARTNNETLGGSPTAMRNRIDEGFDIGGGAALGMDAASAAMTGGAPVASLARVVAQGISDRARLGVGMERAGRVGPTLLDANPSNALAALDELDYAITNRLPYEQSVRKLGGVFGAGGGIGAANYFRQ